MLELDEFDEVQLDELVLEVIERLELDELKLEDEVEVMFDDDNSDDETEAERMVIDDEADGDEVMALYEILAEMMTDDDEVEVDM